MLRAIVVVGKYSTTCVDVKDRAKANNWYQSLVRFVRDFLKALEDHDDGEAWRELGIGIGDGDGRGGFVSAP